MDHTDTTLIDLHLDIDTIIGNIVSQYDYIIVSHMY